MKKKKKLSQKESLIWFLARLKSTTYQSPNQEHNQINQFIFVITPTILGFYYHIKHLSISSK